VADFKTHLAVAAVGSGLLPDVDLDNSSPTKLMFPALAIVFAFLVAFNRAAQCSFIEL